MLCSWYRLGIVAAVVASFGVCASASIIIDDFTSTTAAWPMAIYVTDANMYSSAETGLAGVLGGDRIVQLGQTVMDFDGLDSVVARVFTGGAGIFDYASSVGAVGVAEITYNVARDFSALPLIEMSLLRFDGPGGVDMPVKLIATTTANETHTFTAMTSGGGAQTLSWLMSGAWLTNVATLSFVFDGVPVGADFRIDAITADVPEPGALILLGFGTFLTVLTRRRRTA